MRPPKVTSSLPPKITAPALNYTSDVIMEQISSAAWRYKNKEKLVIFCVNVSDESGEFSLEFNADEYGLCDFELPDGFILEGNVCKICATAPAESYMVWELKAKK